MMSRTNGILSAAMLMIIATGVASLVPANAEPGDPPPHAGPEPDPVRLAVNEVADTLMRFEDEPGFARVEVDYDKSTVIVRWKGQPSPVVQELIEAAPADVSVTVAQAKFTRDEILEAGAKLLSTEEGLGSKRSIMGVRPNGDMSGLVVDLAQGSAALNSPLDTRQAFSALVSIPVTLDETGRLVELSRQNDSAPWQGGGAIAEDDGDDYCSVGFAVIRNGDGRLLSARHCFYANGVGSAVNDGAGQDLGAVSNAQRNGDTVLIDPDANADTLGKVYGGAWNEPFGSPNYQFNVGGASNPAEGADICTSGAVTGDHCNVTAQNTYKVFPCAIQLGGSCIGFEAWHNNSNGVAFGAGDSGGPVYLKLGDGRVGARGIISNTTATSTPCGATSETTTCWRWGNIVNIIWILDHWGATIDTN